MVEGQILLESFSGSELAPDLVSGGSRGGYLVTVHTLYLYSSWLLQFTLCVFVALVRMKKFCRKYIVRIRLYDELQNTAF